MAELLAALARRWGEPKWLITGRTPTWAAAGSTRCLDDWAAAARPERARLFLPAWGEALPPPAVRRRWVALLRKGPVETPPLECPR